MPATLRRGPGASNRPARLPSVGVPMTMTWPRRGWLAALLAAAALGMTTPHVSAQSAFPAPQPKSTPAETKAAPPTREDLQTLLDTLKDPAKRDELAQQIETLLAARQPQT